ncbi:ABC transporter permease [candidate division KSB1 bacterium]
MKNRFKKTPFFGALILKFFLPRSDSEFLLEDFRSVYCEKRDSKGRISAWLWFWRQVFKTAPRFFVHSVNLSFDMFKNYLKIAIRNLKRQKIYTFINISGLALGMACCLLILLWVQNELNFDKFHKNAENIFEIRGKVKMGNLIGFTGAPLPMGETLKEEYPEVVEAARLHPLVLVVKKYNDPLKHRAIFTDPSFFNIFSFKIKKAQSSNYLQKKNEVIITESTAKRHFGSEEPIGQSLSILINGTYKDFLITGVIENFPNNSSIKGDLLINIVNIYGDILHNWNTEKNWSTDKKLGIFVKLNNKNFAGELENNFPDFLKKHTPEENITYHLQPLVDYHLKGDGSWIMRGSSSPVLSYILSGIAFFVLITACFNFMNMAIGSSSARTKEIAVRKVVGADKNSLVKQFLLGALTQSFFALLAGVLLTYLFLPTFNSLANKTLNIKHLAGLEAIGIIVILTVLTGILAGSYPALVLARFKSVDLLRKKFGVSRKNLLTKLLIILQFTISIFLIVSTLFLNKQYKFMINKNLGYSPETVILVTTENIRDLPGRGKTFFTNLKSNLLKYSDIESICRSTRDLTSGYGGSLSYKKEGNIQKISFNRIDEDYLKTLGINIIEGRNFSIDYSSDLSKSVIVNERFVKEFDVRNPIGKRFSEIFQVEDENRDYTIVGVTNDYHSGSLHYSIRPVYHQFLVDGGGMFIYIKIKPGDFQSTISRIKKEFNKTAPYLPFTYSFLDELLIEKYSMEERWNKIVNYSSFFAILIACSGLFGLTLLTIVKRTKEITIRKVLGASIISILRLIQKEFVLLVIAANIFAWPVSYFAVKKVFRNFAYSIPLDFIPFVIAGVSAALLASLIIGILTFKSALANPVDNLRDE